MKRIIINGKYYRYRRGILIQIPDKWVGNTLHHQTKRKRFSKMPPKMKYYAKLLSKGIDPKYDKLKNSMIDEDA